MPRPARLSKLVPPALMAGLTNPVNLQGQAAQAGFGVRRTRLSMHQGMLFSRHNYLGLNDRRFPYYAVDLVDSMGD